MHPEGVGAGRRRRDERDLRVDCALREVGHDKRLGREQRVGRACEAAVTVGKSPNARASSGKGGRIK